MKRGMIMLALAVGAAAPASAQFLGMPVWNSPKGGTGITIDGDYGKPSNTSGGGSAFGARGSIGFGTLTAGLGFASYKPSGATSSLSSIGADVAFRVIGGSLVPLAVNLQAGAAKTTCTGCTDLTTITLAAGVSVNIPSPGISIEPYVSPGIRISKFSGLSSQSNFGFALGANVGFGMVGVHVAYDYTKGKSGAPNTSILGLGAHVAIKVPGL